MTVYYYPSEDGPITYEEWWGFYNDDPSDDDSDDEDEYPYTYSWER